MSGPGPPDARRALEPPRQRHKAAGAALGDRHMRDTAARPALALALDLIIVVHDRQQLPPPLVPVFPVVLAQSIYDVEVRPLEEERQQQRRGDVVHGVPEVPRHRCVCRPHPPRTERPLTRACRTLHVPVQEHAAVRLAALAHAAAREPAPAGEAEGRGQAVGRGAGGVQAQVRIVDLCSVCGS